MSIARTGRRTRYVAALTLAVGVSLASGIAMASQFTEPIAGSAAPAVQAATLPDRQDPREEPVTDEGRHPSYRPG